MKPLAETEGTRRAPDVRSGAESLALLLADPARVRGVPPETVPSLLGELEVLRAQLWARLTAPAVNGQGEAPAEDRLLDVAEVAARLGRSRDYVYRRDWPFEVKGLGRGRRFSAQGLDRYLSRRQGR